MKISCNVIEDLLPLYVEDIISRESAVLIESHIAECENCRRELMRMKKTDDGFDNAREVSAIPLISLKKKVRKKNRLEILKGVFTASIVLVLFFALLVRPTYITESDFQIHENTAGNIVLVSGQDFTDYRTEISEINGKQVMYLYLTSSKWSELTKKPIREVAVSQAEETIDSIYYYTGDESDNFKLIYGDDINEGACIVMPQGDLTFMAFIAGGVAIVLGVLWRAFRAKKTGRICRGLFPLPVVFILSTIVIRIWAGDPFQVLTNFIYIVALTVCAYGLVLTFMVTEDL